MKGNSIRKDTSVEKPASKLFAWGDFRLQMLLLALLVIPMSALGQGTYVGGEIIVGTWTREGSPYFVTQTVRVNDELLIEAGVEVYFLGSYAIEILSGAKLLAVGSPELGQRITFHSSSITWEGISFINADVTSQMTNCDIFNAATAINCIQSDIQIRYCNISAESVAINCVNSSPIIENNHTIEVYGEGDTGSSYKTISIQNQSNPRIVGNAWIHCNASFGNSATGIDIFDSQAEITGNWIEVNAYDTPRGIKAEFSTGLDIIRNIIRVQSSPDSRGLELEGSTNVRVYNNNIRVMDGSPAMGVIGIMVTAASHANIINNIIIGNDVSISIWAAGAQLVNLDSSGYNLHFRHLMNYLGTEPLRNDRENEDPLFHTENHDSMRAYFIQWHSPCRDVGFPGWIDPHNNSRSDIGRFWCTDDSIPPDDHSVLQRKVIHPTEFRIVTAYPNPFNSFNTIKFSLPVNEQVRLSVCDLNGREVSLLLGAALNYGEHTVNWDAGGMAPGQYFIHLQAGNMDRFEKIIYLP